MFNSGPLKKSLFPAGTPTLKWVLGLLLLLPLGGLAIASDEPGHDAAGQNKVPPPEAYAGAAACAECHRKEAASYANTPHALDSSLPSAKTIAGSFTPDQAVLRTSNPELAFVMLSTPTGFYQAAVNPSDLQHTPLDTKPIDIVFGSGRHGQTYLSWEGDQLFELPVSYWTYTHRWVNSPGYPNGQLRWNRKVVPRCMECHVSYFSAQPPPINRYLKDNLVLGIDCERCHGPGAQHVKLERSATPPPRGSAQLAIVNPARLTGDRQIGLCALCHSGGAPSTGRALTFVVGQDINQYLKLTPPSPSDPVDVHGNQVGALEQSKCFTSGKMTCSTCHNVHETQENADAFSSHCLSCHEVKKCGRFRSMGEAIRGKCVECHMPVDRSKSIVTIVGGQTIHATMRTHRIAIYPEARLEGPDTEHSSNR